ncbi:MAG: ATP-dependent DNA helicase RecG [Rickettsiaceae bacterium]|nr:ATP-dependent DNA helicase RecG [Rickettsiaceae bacterium]
MHRFLEEINIRLRITKSNHAALKRLGIQTVSDLLLYKPEYYVRRFINPNLSHLKHGQDIAFSGKIEEIQVPAKRTSPLKIECSNSTGSISLVYFSMPSGLKKILSKGKTYIFSGKVQFYDYYPQITHPEIIFDKSLLTHEDPKYSLTYGLTHNMIRNYIFQIIRLGDLSIKEWLPGELITQYGLPAFMDAIHSIHSLPNNNTPKNKAILRLKYDEALSNQLGFRIAKEKTKVYKTENYPVASKLKSDILANFPYNLTKGQINAINDIEKDQSQNIQMFRMIHGDVGCGKTIVALVTSLNVIDKGSQVAIMAPTEVLASQHFQFVTKMLRDTNHNAALLTSKMSQKEQKLTLTDIENGLVSIVIGTHSLISEKVKFKKLGYVIIDEQHKFGVNQRYNLISKGENPDILIMSATPIPRTLAMTYFGNLDITKIPDMPSSRIAVKTLVVSASRLSEIEKLLATKIEKNEKIYWICPLIEQNEEDPGLYSDVKKRYDYLSNIFAEKVSYIHGFMSQEEKNLAIEQFKNGNISILVSTTVVEVGVDVPDATLIVIENAEKFGLAQLHQLRGRVGRGSLESMCVLLYGKATSKIAYERFKVMKESNDGFYIAEKDLLMRGEGELLGEKQSGVQNFRFLDIEMDAKIIEEAADIAKYFTDHDLANIVVLIFNKFITQKNIVI